MIKFHPAAQKAGLVRSVLKCALPTSYHRASSEFPAEEAEGLD